jgi:hypothetical protein
MRVAWGWMCPKAAPTGFASAAAAPPRAVLSTGLAPQAASSRSGRHTGTRWRAVPAVTDVIEVS